MPLTAASRFVGQERFKVVFGDQPAASGLYRSELAGAQQVMDELTTRPANLMTG
jgi:hypothetical protein